MFHVNDCMATVDFCAWLCNLVFHPLLISQKVCWVSGKIQWRPAVCVGGRSWIQKDRWVGGSSGPASVASKHTVPRDLLALNTDVPTLTQAMVHLCCPLPPWGTCPLLLLGCPLWGIQAQIQSHPEPSL